MAEAPDRPWGLGGELNQLVWKTDLISEINFLHCFQAADTVPAHEDQTLTYSIKDLLPFTVYGAGVACRGDSNIWSDWSAEVTVGTPDMSN